MSTHTTNVAILGASGYTGAELIRLLLPHPKVRIALLTADSNAGKKVAEIYPHLGSAGLPDLLPLDAADYNHIDVVFCCLPHGATQEVVARLPAHLKVIDLSADFRLRDEAEYAKWYGHAHRAPALQKEAVYGLTEHARPQIRKARLVANPGCYPTSALLPLIPLLKAGLIRREGIIIDAKSGVTGAGRAAKQGSLFAELDGGLYPYGVGVHRHMPEIEQGLSEAAGAGVQVMFTPHLIPMNRGLLSTIYVSGDAATLRDCLKQAYADEPFITITAPGVAPSTHEVRGTNRCTIGVFEGRAAGQAVLVSAIDNLCKGASGQAVQNMNVMLGFEETLGLGMTAIFP